MLSHYRSLLRRTLRWTIEKNAVDDMPVSHFPRKRSNCRTFFPLETRTNEGRREGGEGGGEEEEKA